MSHSRETVSRSQWRVLCACFAAVFFLAVSGQAEPVSGPWLEVQQEFELPEILEWSRDLRWIGPEKVLVASPRAGVFEVDLRNPSAVPMVEIEKGNRRTASAHPNRLGISDRYLAAGSGIFSLGWRTREADGLQHQVYFELIADLDIFQNKLLALAIRKGEKGTRDTLPYDQDGAYLWLADLTRTDSVQEDDSQRFEPLAFSASGARAKAMDPCSLFAPGAVRFAADGSFLVVPQAEHGVQLYSAEGRLVKTWESAAAGIDSGCQLNEEEWTRFAADVESRQAWVNARRVVDDIAFVDGKPAVLVRERQGEITRWQMNVLGDKAIVQVLSIPIESRSGRARLGLDQQGERIAFLLGSRENPLPRTRTLGAASEDHPEEPGRIFVAKLVVDEPPH